MTFDDICIFHFGISSQTFGWYSSEWYIGKCCSESLLTTQMALLDQAAVWQGKEIVTGAISTGRVSWRLG